MAGCHGIQLHSLGPSMQISKCQSGGHTGTGGGERAPTLTSRFFVSSSSHDIRRWWGKAKRRHPWVVRGLEHLWTGALCSSLFSSGLFCTLKRKFSVLIYKKHVYITLWIHLSLEVQHKLDRLLSVRNCGGDDQVWLLASGLSSPAGSDIFPAAWSCVSHSSLPSLSSPHDMGVTVPVLNMVCGD